MTESWRRGILTQFTACRFIACLCVISLLGLSPAKLRAEDPLTLRGQTMGTSYSIKYFPCATSEEAKIVAGIATRLAEIDERMSTYRDDSELSRFNQTAKPGEWFEVSAETAEVAEMALKIAKQTDGAFDPTVGPLVDLWKFGPQSGAKEFTPPSDEAIRDVMQRVGFDKLQVRIDPPALKKDVAGLTLDLSAIAKGHGVDALLEVLLSNGIGGAMVEIGGEVRTFGPRGPNRSWRIGVEEPTVGARSLMTVVPLDSRAMATSGDYRNFYEHQGKRYSHTIDPRSGRPVEHHLGSVTILAATCARADALATALLVMGPEAGQNWANENNVAALLLVREGEAITAEVSNTFPDLDNLAVNTSASNAAETAPQAGFFTVLLIAMVVFGIALFGMAIGVVLSNRSIQGSCGGLAGMKDDDGNTLCFACGDPSPDCSGEGAESGDCDAPDATSHACDAPDVSSLPRGE